MKLYFAAVLATTAALALSACGQGGAENTQAVSQQPTDPPPAASDWYNQHRDNLPEGLRPEDRLSPEQESRLKVGVVLDNDIRDRVRPAPPELAQRLPPPPPEHRYVAVGGHVGLVDKDYKVKAVINLHK